jgi:hypothetical protein
MGVLTAGHAKALVVNVNGQDWDVTTFTGTIARNYSKFASPTSGGVMPWWDDTSGSLARQFSDLVGLELGFPNDPSLGSDYARVGPLFAIGVPGPLIHSSVFSSKYNKSIWLASSPNRSHTFAQVTPASSAAVPGPLPALGAAAAFGHSRKLRKRINRNTKTGSGAYCL